MNVSVKTAFNFFPVFFFALLLSNCDTKVKKTASESAEPISYLALGDSYTIGTGIEQENNYPNQLADSLATLGFQMDTTLIIATNGWTTADLKNGIAEHNPSSDFDLVSLLIGVNNQYQWLDIELYKAEFRELLEQAIGFAGGDSRKVFVISIPNYGVTPFAQSKEPETIRRKISEYNSIAEDISGEYGITFINITPISEMAEEDLSLLAPDELHPSTKMYSMWVEEMLPTVTHILEP
ncbi:SGNH/GDSL hydrolase family protein [Gracilimonas sediminicola]|uniref:SGNH/GDSL hydrolase family protein n=1 Tax=Gracilimonas sediminicola TaxID=2952158 RepID=A0A9X2L145_9BACT|nr:SGNH/GDSL hydrolase family protein [Gracilimonas sediminicola]MCP9290408.1 SGNH/GDSL hydrolase family protein [Gracilimonas sediminicola]